MTAQDTETLLTSIGTLGAAILAGTVPATAATFVLSAIIRETPHLVYLASVALVKGGLTPEQKAQARAEAEAMAAGNIGNIPIATDLNWPTSAPGTVPTP